MPDWLKSMIARDLAHNTLSDLRARVHWARTHGAYRERANWLAALGLSEGCYARDKPVHGEPADEIVGDRTQARQDTTANTFE